MCCLCALHLKIGAMASAPTDAPAVGADDAQVVTVVLPAGGADGGNAGAAVAAATTKEGTTPSEYMDAAVEVVGQQAAAAAAGAAATAEPEGCWEKASVRAAGAQRARARARVAAVAARAHGRAPCGFSFKVRAGTANARWHAGLARAQACKRIFLLAYVIV